MAMWNLSTVLVTDISGMFVRVGKLQLLRRSDELLSARVSVPRPAHVCDCDRIDQFRKERNFECDVVRLERYDSRRSSGVLVSSQKARSGGWETVSDLCARGLTSG